MNLNKLAAIIPLISVAVMILWGVFGNDWGHSWIAVVIGGITGAIIRVLAGKDGDDHSSSGN